MLNKKLLLNVLPQLENMSASYVQHRQSCIEHNIHMDAQYRKHCRRYKHLYRRDRVMVDHLFDVQMGA